MSGETKEHSFRSINATHKITMAVLEGKASNDVEGSVAKSIAIMAGFEAEIRQDQKEKCAEKIVSCANEEGSDWEFIDDDELRGIIMEAD